jgi:HTH-like domain
MKAAIGQMRIEYAFNERRACGLVMLAVSSCRYQRRRSDEPLRTKLVELAREKPRFGYRRLQVLLRRSGERVNHKRLHRVYREAGLSLRRKKRKHCVRVGQPLRTWTAANQEWALDFVHDAVDCGRAIRVLSIVDAYTRECFGAGSGHEFCQPKSDASAGCDRGPAGTTESDPLRQRAGVNGSAFSSLVCGATDRVGTHSAGKANPERTRREH